MPKNGACCLSSINLSEYVINSFTKEAFFDIDQLMQDMEVYVRAADRIIDESAKLHALPEQQKFALNYRNIGIGIMGLGTMFLKLGIRFGSEKSITSIKTIMHHLFRKAVMTSNQLACKLGSFPKYDPIIFDSEIIKNHFNESEIATLKRGGLRNSSLLSVAPTGSIGTLLGISTGAEAYFSDSYYRKTVSLNGNEDKYYKVDLPIFKEAKLSNINKDSIVTVRDIPWKDRIDIQSALQYSVDTAISSTCNLSKETTIEEIEQIYLYAWKKGLKGLTIYVDGCRDGVLVDSVFEPKKSNQPHKSIFDYITPVSRKTLGTTSGTTSCKKCACGTLYITCNKDQEGNLVEVFTHTSKGGICQANMNAVTRMISLSLRSGVKVSEIEDQLKGINCPACTTCKARGINIDGLSCPDIISRVIKESINSNQVCVQIKDTQNKIVNNQQIEISNTAKCPECGEPLISQGGCRNCQNCGWSKCN